MSKIKGQELMLFLGGKSIAYATSHTLEISAETSDTSNKDEVAVIGQVQKSANSVGPHHQKTFSAQMATVQVMTHCLIT